MNLRISFAAALLTALLVSACDKPAARGSATMTINGMKITASGGNPSVVSDGKTVTVSVDAKKVIIQDDDILVAGVKQAKIPADTKTITVFSRNDAIVIEMDGKEATLAGR